MSNRKILSLILLSAIVVIGGIMFWGAHNEKSGDNAVVDVEAKTASAVDLHKGILRAIAEGKVSVGGISPEDAEKELQERTGKELAIDAKPAVVQELPFEIVKLIARSPATIAGITPKVAINEIVKRYLSIDLIDSDDVSSTVLLEALQHREEKKAIEDWANNEDAEVVEAFMKEEADKDPSSIANFALGLKKIDTDHDLAITYMDRFANHTHADSFDNPNEEAAYKELIEAIKKLK